MAAVYGKDVLTVSQYQMLKIHHVLEATWIAIKDTINALIVANRRITTREVAEGSCLSNWTVDDQLKGLGLTSKLMKKFVWLRWRLWFASWRSKNDPSLKCIITMDKKWVVNKRWCSLWWDIKGIVFLWVLSGQRNS